MLAASAPVPASAGRAEAGTVAGARGGAERAGQSDAAAGCAPALALGDVGIAAGGQFRLMGNRSNFGFHDRTAGPHQAPNTIGNQRFRTWVNVHDRTSCRYGGYAQIEIGHLNLGSGLEFPKTFGPGGDQVGLEMRRGFLWFRPAEGALVRAGVLPWEDRFGERPTFADPLWGISRAATGRAPLANSAWEFSVSGVTLEATAGDAWHYALGALLLDRDARAGGGQDGSWLLTVDLDREIGSSLWGASVYYLRDDAGYSYGGFGGPAAGSGAAVERSRDLWFGGRGHVEHAGGSTGLFLILNSGEIPALGWSHAGWSAKVATTLPAGRGAVHLQGLYATGDDGGDPNRSGEFRTIAQSVRDDLGAQAYWSLVGLTSPRGPSDVNDLGIGLQNGGLGLRTLQAGYEHPPGPAVDGVSRGRLAELGRRAPRERLDGHGHGAAGGGALGDGRDDGPRVRCVAAARRRLLQARRGGPCPRDPPPDLQPVAARVLTPRRPASRVRRLGRSRAPHGRRRLDQRIQAGSPPVRAP